MIKSVVVIGAGGLGRETVEVLKKCLDHKHQILGYIDDNPRKQGLTLNGYPVLGGMEWFEDADPDVVLAICGIGNNEARAKVTRKAEGLGFEFINAVHPSVSMGDTVELSRGDVVTAGNILTCNIKVGNHVFINLDCTVGHDTIFEDYVNLSPGVHISGNCTLLEGSHIYTGAVLIRGVTIGKWAVIGAGAVVLKDVPDYAVAVGVPAIVKKYRTPEHE